MGDARYFVIFHGEGDTGVEQMNRETLLERLDEEYYGDDGFLKELEDGDMNSWGGKILIVKGEIVVPKPKTVVKTYEL